jgi:hypothetical protein
MMSAQGKAIRDSAAAGENKSALAREYGVTRQTIYDLIAAYLFLGKFRIAGGPTPGATPSLM